MITLTMGLPVAAAEVVVEGAGAEEGDEDVDDGMKEIEERKVYRKETDPVDPWFGLALESPPHLARKSSRFRSQ